jgi:cyanophycin synthetase
MQILESRTYTGPNLYANFPVIRIQLDLGPLEDHPSAKIDGFVDALLEALPSLAEHGCSYGEPGGFVRRLREEGGTWMGHILEHVAIEIQNLCGAQVTFGKTRTSGEHGQYHVVYEYEQATVGEQSGELALRLLHNLVPDHLSGVEREQDFAWQDELDEMIRRAQRRAFGPSTGSLVRAAVARDIPWLRLNEYSLVQFGHGRHQKRIQATITSETRHIAVDVASDKEETNKILGDLGLPVPRQAQCYRSHRAVRAANRIGYPVVIKPLNANHGRGVSIGLTTDAEVEVAYLAAKEHSRCVLVESYIAGFDHRLLVVDGELVAAAKRVPGHVIGDGERSISQLIDVVNQDPRRGIGHEKVLTKLELDAQAIRLLDEAGHTADTVLPAGETFFLRSTANLSTGGTAIDVTDEIHPDNRDMAVRAAAAIGLDVCGVDFLTDDITHSYKDIGGGICEVNAAPGFRMHVAPSQGTPRDVAGKVIDMLFPPGTDTRIPIAAITGTNGKTTTTRMLAHIHKLAGETVGMTTTDGVYIDGQLTVAGDMTGPIAAQMVLRDPAVSVAVLETARGGMLRAGLGYRRPNVACCLNVAADHLGQRGINTLDQLADVKRIPIDVASDTAVLNADDPRCLKMAAHTNAAQVCYVTMNSQHPLVREHIRAGGRAVALEHGMNGEMITLYDGGAHMPLLWTHLIPASLEGKATHNVQNAMFAAAMAHAMGVRLDDIRQGLRTFDTSYFQAPGRMNIHDEHGFKIIVDYGHNPAAIDAMSTLVDRLADESTGQKVVVLSVPGDRRDEDVLAVASRVATSFDHFVVRRDDRRRGRGDDEIPQLLRQGLIDAGVDPSRITVSVREEDAVNHALEMCAPSDLLLIFCDQITRTWKQVIYFGTGRPETQKAPVDSAPTPVTTEAAPPPNTADWTQDSRGVFLAAEDD